MVFWLDPVARKYVCFMSSSVFKRKKTGPVYILTMLQEVPDYNIVGIFNYNVEY